MIRCLGVIVVSILGLISFNLSAAAQTPESNAPECALKPLELPLFGGTPVATYATPSPVVAKPLSVDEARSVLQMYVACINTGDPTLVWAMFTPRWFAQEFADPSMHYLPGLEQMLDQPGVPPLNPLVLGEKIQVNQLADGRTEVRATFSNGDQTWDDSLILVNIDGAWLIDDVIHH